MGNCLPEARFYETVTRNSDLHHCGASAGLAGARGAMSNIRAVVDGDGEGGVNDEVINLNDAARGIAAVVDSIVVTQHPSQARRICAPVFPFEARVRFASAMQPRITALKHRCRHARILHKQGWPV